MAQATVELRTLIENVSFQLFDFTYSFDDQTFKTALEQSVTDFYYDYEIGFETPDMFKRKFKARWNRIIPFYNELYNTTVLEYDPLKNKSITEVLDAHKTNNSTQTSTLSDTRNGTTTTDGTLGNDTTITTNSDSKASDYPQQAIGTGDYLQGEQTTNGSETHNVSGTTNTTVTDSDTASSNGTLSNSDTVQENNTKTVDGLEGTTYQALIQAKRDLIINIKNKVIEEMKPCFILTY